MHNSIVTLVLANILMTSMVGMEPTLKNEKVKAKSENITLKSEIQLSDGTQWRFSADSQRAVFTQKKKDTFDVEMESPVFRELIQTKSLKAVCSLGITEWYPGSIMAVVLATLKKKNDMCIFIQLARVPLCIGPGIKIFNAFHSLNQIVSSMSIDKLRISHETNRDHIRIMLSTHDETHRHKDQIIYDFSKSTAISEKSLKTCPIEK